MTDSCNKHEERYFYDIKLWVWSQISWGAWEANVSAGGGAKFGGGGFFSPVLEGLLSGKKTCKTEAEVTQKRAQRTFREEEVRRGSVASPFIWAETGFLKGWGGGTLRQGTDSVARSFWGRVFADRPPLLLQRPPSRLRQKKKSKKGARGRGR